MIIEPNTIIERIKIPTIRNTKGIVTIIAKVLLALGFIN